MRSKRVSEPSEAASGEHRTSARSSATWAMLIKRVYELAPLACPECGEQMKVVAFIEPPPREVIEKILKHCGLWPASSARPPPPVGNPSYGNLEDVTCRFSVGSRELTYVDQDTFETLF